jgi:hypothetical protein
MRLALLLFAVASCAARNRAPSSPQPSPAPVSPLKHPTLDGEALRACESCRWKLDLCKKRLPLEQYQGPSGLAICMEDFMACLKEQQLDPIQCAGPE